MLGNALEWKSILVKSSLIVRVRKDKKVKPI